MSAARTRPMQPAATTTNSSSLPSLTRGPRSHLLRLDAPIVHSIGKPLDAWLKDMPAVA
uniref:Uncharacterized protein n=1 Tax=Zea mays TaxID=4577 RepID=B6UB31_MAIZE|nr:hypothetical protein [Zea mays]